MFVTVSPTISNGNLTPNRVYLPPRVSTSVDPSTFGLYALSCISLSLQELPTQAAVCIVVQWDDERCPNHFLVLFLALLDRPPLVAASEPDGKFTEPGRQALLGEPTNLQPQQKEPTELTKDGGEE